MNVSSYIVLIRFINHLQAMLQPRILEFAKVMFSQVSVCQQRGGGVRGCQGVCVVARGCAWLAGGMHGVELLVNKPLLNIAGM